MKHLRFINLLIVMLLLTAWAPAPQTPDISAAALAAAPVLTGPANGALITGYKPDFTWKQPTYALDIYEIEFSFDTNFKDPTKFITSAEVEDVPASGIITYKPDFDLPSNSLVYWRVRSVISDGVYSNWAKRSVKTKPLSPPAIIGPTGGEDVHTLQPLLRWTLTPDADAVVRSNQFEIQVRLKDGKTIKTATVTGAQYQYPSDLKRDTAYQWRIRVKGKYFTDPVYSGWQDFVTANPPSVPVLTAQKSGFVIPVGATELLFTWKPSTSTKNPTPVITYKMQVALDAKFKDVVINPDGIPTEQYLHNLASAPFQTGTYYWRVMAVDDEGDMSNWSAARTFKTQPALLVHIVDYLTGDPIENARVTITGFPEVTDEDGTIQISPIKAGSKTITAIKDDYVTKKMSTSAVNGMVREVTLAMVHIPMKAVLSWKTTDNLDLHLWIPEDAARDPDKIDGHIMADHRGVTTKHPWAKLSGDIAKGGKTPETITIQNRYPGDYYLAVFDYRALPIKNTQATIKIYRGSTLAETLSVPITGDGRWWLAAVIDGATGTIKVDEAKIQTTSPGPYDPDGGTFAVPEE